MVEEARRLVNILMSHEIASSQRNNFKISELSCNRNLPSPRIDELTRLLV